MKKTVDIICVGEVVIDFIGHEINTSIANTKNYLRFLGGSPTNVAVNAARLGLKSVLVATCGADGFGSYIIKKLEENKVITSQIKKTEEYPTSIIFVTKSNTTPDFIAYRHADCQINSTQITEELLESAKIFHTTCFALSKNPSRFTILESAKKAKSLGLQLSIDINYSDKIWPDREEAHQVLKEYLLNDPLVKVSEDDCFRLFGEIKSEVFIFDYFHGLGITTVCLTKGKNGVQLSDTKQGMFFQEAIPLDEIKDTTGAGDAFWTGFLYAKLQNQSVEQCISIAQTLASIKLQNVGQLPDNFDLNNS